MRNAFATSSGWYDIRTWILSFGKDAEVLEPESMRKILKDEIATLSRVYF